MAVTLEETVNHYLYYGYWGEPSDYDWVSDCFASGDAGWENTAQGAADLLDYSLDDLLDKVGAWDQVIIPLSGGWDSRILLGAAMERFNRHQIKTVSFGVPGQLDFDIGGQIAKTFGLQHRGIDLSKVNVTWEALLGSVKQSPWTYVPDGYFNKLAISEVAGSGRNIVLSGFMGDPITGGHLSDATTKDEVVEEFLSKQRREKSIQLYRPEYDPRRSLIELPDESLISHSELLDLSVRQSSCIAPIVTPQKQWREWGGDMGRMHSTGGRLIAPFVHPEWAAFWLSVPQELKREQKLYLDMMHYKFPALAAMPSKYSLGSTTKIGYFSARVRRKMWNRLDSSFPKFGMRYSAGLNYLDFAKAFRERPDYQMVLDKALTSLKENDVTPWLDLDTVKRQHMSYKANHENAFLVLVGLALNLQVDGGIS